MKLPKSPPPNYLKSAPAELITLSNQIRVGRDILLRLLTDKQMSRSWSELSKRITKRGDWHCLWTEIAYAVRKAKKHTARGTYEPTMRQKQREEFKNIQTKANALLEALRDEGPLDLRSYEIFPDDVMGILGISGWSSRDPLEKSDLAHTLLTEWPTIKELIIELANKAGKLEEGLRASKQVRRRGNNERERYFATHISDYFKHAVGSPLYGTVANITNATFGSSIQKEQVEKWVSRSTN